MYRQLQKTVSLSLAATIGLASTQFSGCIRKPQSQQKSLRNDSGDLLYENLAINDPELLVKAFANSTDIVSQLPICYFKLRASSQEGNASAPESVAQYPILLGEALNLFASQGVNFSVTEFSAVLNKEFNALLANAQTVPSSSSAPSSASLEGQGLELSGAEMSLLPLGLARVFLGTKLLGWSSVAKILGAMKFVANPVKGQIATKAPGFVKFMTNSIAKVTAKTALVAKTGKALSRVKNIRNIRAAKGALIEKKGLAKVLGGVSKMATHSVMWLPWFAGDIYRVVKDSGVAGKNPTEDQVAKQLELFTPEQLEEMTTKAVATTEARFDSSPALQNQLAQTAQSMNDALAKFELKSDDNIFALVESEITRLGVSPTVSSIPCVNADESLLEEAAAL